MSSVQAPPLATCVQGQAKYPAAAMPPRRRPQWQSSVLVLLAVTAAAAGCLSGTT